jgi:hypothetical protein
MRVLGPQRETRSVTIIAVIYILLKRDRRELIKLFAISPVDGSSFHQTYGQD